MNTAQQTNTLNGSESSNAMKGGMMDSLGHRVANFVMLASLIFVVLGSVFGLIR